MSGIIYLVNGENRLLPMEEQAYNSESILQSLVANHPALLSGDDFTDGQPRRWLLVSREVAVAGEEGNRPWSVDHLFLDQEGVPTFVEVKRSTDSRIRREVVGQ